MTATALQARAPAQTLTIIEAGRGVGVFDWKELWQFRELLFFLAWRDIKVRYKQTTLGALWAVLQPLAIMTVFTLFIGRLAPAPRGGIPYPLFVLLGLAPWTFLSSAIASSAQSIIGSQNLVTKIYFPRLFIPMGAVMASLVDFAISFSLVIAYCLYSGIVPGLQLWLLPFVLVALLVTALGAGTLLSALTVAYRDFRHVVPFMIQVWMFATPSIYLDSPAAAGSRAHYLLPLNPAYGLVVAFRAALLGGPVDWYTVAVSGAVGVSLLVIGCLYFKRVERSFADVI